MNLREGRIGRQEAAALALTGCTVGGLFAQDPGKTYQSGNSAYLSGALSAVLALLLFFLLAEAMNRKGCRNLSALYRFAYGPVLAVPMALVTFLALLFSAAAPMMRLFDILARFVYPEAAPENLLLYPLACVAFLSWKGLETLGRTVRLLFPLVALSVIAALVVAAPAYEPARLYPLLGNGLVGTLLQGASAGGRFFAPLLCLLVCGAGVQSLGNAAGGASVGALGGGLLTAGTQLCLGMTYPYELLRSFRAPMYRLTMSVRTGSAYLRMDKLLVFLWTMGGLLAGGFYAYSAALLYASCCRMRDVRPPAAAAAVSLSAVLLLSQRLPELAEQAAGAAYPFLPIALALPPMLAAALASVRKGAAE